VLGIIWIAARQSIERTTQIAYINSVRDEAVGRIAIKSTYPTRMVTARGGNGPVFSITPGN
jgi:hypothetical protein